MSTNENRSFCLPFLLALALAFLPLPGHAQVPVEVYAPGSDVPINFPSAPAPANPLPVLFVHGHNLLDENQFPSYQNNWVDRLCDLPSFDQALARNPQLGIEPYYLRFRNQHRSIEDDATEIARAVDLILKRHDPAYDPQDPARSTHARVAVIAASKGTISTRLYLKWLSDYGADGCDGSRDLPCVASGFSPVSEFIAVAPPNHGLRLFATDQVKASDALSQLNNGRSRICLELEKGRDFIENLNGHPICDTCSVGCPICPCEKAWTEPRKIFPSEAPLSRAPGDSGRAGILYLTLFAENGGDELAGGDRLSGDCQGRELALNLAPDAVNVTMAEENVSSSCLATVHGLTPHWPETICRALYAAAYHRVPEAALNCPRDAEKVPEVPAPPAANAMLALDLSGSMGWPACSGSDCREKVEYLREAVELFVHLWQVVARPQDRIGAVYFRSEADLVQIGGDVLGPVGSHGQAISGDLAGQQPGGSTAMGGALHSAIEVLEDLTPNEADTRHVILFTDGMQNRNPMVQQAADGGLMIEDDRSRRPFPSGYAPLDLDDAGGIRIHTIGVGAGDASTALLQEIATQTGGSFKSSPDVEDLRRFFIEEVIEVMRGFSPQLIGYRRHSTGADGKALETFDVDGVAGRVIFMVHAEKGKDFTLRVEKGNEDVTAQARIVDGLYFRILTFDLPLEVDGKTIEAGGEWKLTIQNAVAGDLAYEALALVDDVKLVHEASVGGPMVAGRPLELTVALSAAGQPVTGAAVSARVWNAGSALGTLLATTPMPRVADLAFEAAATGGQKKLQALLQQDWVSAQLKPLEPLGAQVDLLDQGAGTYRASYDGTATPGTYKVVFRIHGSDDRVGEYRRTETLSAQVEIGHLDPDRLRPELRIVERSADSLTVKLILRPRDAGGHYLGPDYGDRIRVTLDSAAPAPVVDRLDGSYEITLSVPTKRDPRLELAVLGRQLFAQPFSKLPIAPGPGWVFGANLGITLPAGTLDTFYDPGPLAELTLERAISPRFALHGVLGRYRFDPGFDVDGVTLYLRYYRPWKSPAHRPGSTRLFAEIGPGVYDPDGTDPLAGLSAGFGVVRPFRPGFEGELGAGYFHLFNSGDDLRFAALKVGLRYSF